MLGILSLARPTCSRIEFAVNALPPTFYCRLENDAFDEDGNSLSDMSFGGDQLAIRSPPSLNDDAYTLYYPQEKR